MLTASAAEEKRSVGRRVHNAGFTAAFSVALVVAARRGILTRGLVVAGRFVAVWFLILRCDLPVHLFAALGKVFRQSFGWQPPEHADNEEACAFIDAVHMLHSRGLQRWVRAFLTAVTLPLAATAPGTLCTWMVPGFLCWDLCRGLRGQRRPKSFKMASGPRVDDGEPINGGLEVLHPPCVEPRCWFAFEGAMCACFYYMGLMHGIYQRFGKEAFAAKRVGFTGSSSGGFCAGYAGVPVLHGPYSCQHWAFGQMSVPAKFWQLMPLGMLFAVPLAVKRSGMWAMRTCRKFERVCDELQGGAYLMWLLHTSGLTAGGARFWWRRVVKCTASDVELFGDECAACGFLPLLGPALLWPCNRHGLTIDGHLHGLGLPCKPVLSDPRVSPGRCLVFACSSNLHEPIEGTVRIEVTKWRKFSIWGDFLMGFGPDPFAAAQRLFDHGLEDSYLHSDELDKAIHQVFGLTPMQASYAGAEM